MATFDKEIRKQVHGKLDEFLKKHNYYLFKNYKNFKIFHREMAHQIRGMISYDTFIKWGKLHLGIKVGAYLQVITEFLAKYYPDGNLGGGSTFNNSLNYMNRKDGSSIDGTWTIRTKSEIPTVLKRVFFILKQDGFTYVENFKTIKAIHKELQGDEFPWPAYIVSLCLEGKKQKAKDEVAKTIRDARDRNLKLYLKNLIPFVRGLNKEFSLKLKVK